MWYTRGHDSQQSSLLLLLDLHAESTLLFLFITVYCSEELPYHLWSLRVCCRLCSLEGGTTRSKAACCCCWTCRVP